MRIGINLVATLGTLSLGLLITNVASAQDQTPRFAPRRFQTAPIFEPSPQQPPRTERSRDPSRLVQAGAEVPLDESTDDAPALAPPLTARPFRSSAQASGSQQPPDQLRESPELPVASGDVPLPIRTAQVQKKSSLASRIPSRSTKPAEPKATANDNSSSDSNSLPSGVTSRVKGELAELWQKLIYVWQYKFYATNGVDISLQVIVVGIVLLWVGHFAAKKISNWFGTKVLTRVGFPPATAAPLQKISFYALFGMFGLFSLNVVGIPLTVFTFFGGALAIGVGFGSQNVMNNFISGLILLAERPIRVGDVIQIDSHSGKVSEIGARSTRITTGANLEVIIPNSTFLQGNVINWTLSDDVISSKVNVGVAYGSAARDVAEVLMIVAREHEQILRSPEPSVAFTDFSDHAMMFELSFWLKMSQADRGKVESDLRFRIDELFGDRGIVIAYPQRDVHLNLMRPVEVRLSDPHSAVRELREAA